MPSSLRASEAIQGRKQGWIASSLTLLAMTEAKLRRVTNAQNKDEEMP
jgi:hypothetical protein